MRLQKLKQIRKKLSSGVVSLGTWQQIPHSSISELLSNSGYDWVAVDLEHGSIGIEKLPDLFRSIELGGALPLARVLESNAKNCKQSLDAGAGGIILPMIENGKQLEDIMNNCFWPPRGNRGVGFSRANLFGKKFDSYIKEAQSPLIVAQIEHIRAIENLDDILQVEGLDAIITGPYDLSASMGITAEFENKEFIKVMKLIISKCKEYKIPCGEHIVEPNPDKLNMRIKQGYRFIAYSTDAIFLYQNSLNPLSK
tara:strand:- start:561 stop:1322 length:762 start_codon:yes stop_codon:yes gene_type:complete